MSKSASHDPRPSSSAPPAEQALLWQEMRAITPPPLAKQRVARALEERRAARPRRYLVPAFAVAAAAVLIGVWIDAQHSKAPSPLRVIAARDVERDGRAIADGALAPGPLEVGDVGHLWLHTGAAAIEITGPAQVDVRARSVALQSGRLDISGDVAIEGPECTARVRGQSQVSVHDMRLEVRVYAGSAELSRPSVSCEVIDLREPAASEAPASGEPGRTAAAGRHEGAGQGSADSQPSAAGQGSAASQASADHPLPGEPAGELVASHPAPPVTSQTARKPAPTRARVVTPDGPSALAQQVDAYWRATRLRERDPRAALRELRAMLHTWPKTELRTEVELAIFDTLVELGRREQASAQARAILSRNPSTPRAAELAAAADMSAPTASEEASHD